MTGFKLQTFAGKAPRMSARLLPEDMAQEAINTRLDAGRLEPWAANQSASITPVASYNITASTKTLFKYSSSIYIGSNEDLDIARSPIAEDSHERIYVTGIGGSSGYPRMSTAAIVGNGTYYKLGIPDPANFDSVTVVGTTTKSDQETPVSRAYIFTYVSAYGEEGPPGTSLVSQIVNVFSDQSVTVNFPANPTGNHNLLKKRLYRTDPNGNFRFVADVALTNDTFNDTVTDANLGESVPSSDWSAPPDDDATQHPDGPLLGLVSMPNGFLAGFSGQTVCFSEAFQPHAFPDSYKLTIKSDVVALAPLNTGLLVLTKEKPALIQGLDPSSMSMTEIDSTLSCVSKRSVVDMGAFVMYASPDGLVMARDSGLSVATEAILSRDQWQELTPSSMIGFFWEGYYVGFYANGSESKGFMFDPRGGKNVFIKLDFHATAGFNDLENDELYLVINGSVVKFAAASTLLSMTWRSKKFYTQRPINPGVAKVEADSYPVSAQTFVVTVVDSGGNKYVFDGGSPAAALTLQRGVTYTFDQSDASNSNHPLRFKDASDSSYTTGVTANGTPGQAGANVVFQVPDNAPNSLRYYCTVHGNAMGNVITVTDRQFITFKLFADGSLKHTQTVTNSSLFRLPGGYKANEFEVQIEGAVVVNEVCVYESAGEVGGA